MQKEAFGSRKRGAKDVKYSRIDPADFPRKAHFEYFSRMAYPYIGVTAEVDITDWLSEMKAAGVPFFHGFLWAAAGAANDVRELRLRILDGGIVEFDVCESSYTVALPDGTYGYCRLATDMPLEDFLPCARKEHERALEAPTLEDGEDALGLFFVSSLPWLSYTALVQPAPMPADSNPRVTWGRFHTVNGRTCLPVTLLCHHALVDGIHLSRFYRRLDERLADMRGRVGDLSCVRAGGQEDEERMKRT
ncbi:MAG: chloramphenicol acetyltransferase [Clostridia bacterium]|nr:chloramphenicol acetyltransferase [Clostridia bacterium]